MIPDAGSFENGLEFYWSPVLEIFLISSLPPLRRIVIVGNGGIATEMVHELESVDIVWSVKDDAIAANFIDAGCAEFFSSSINRTTPEEGSANPEISIAIEHRISGKLRHAKRTGYPLSNLLAFSLGPVHIIPALILLPCFLYSRIGGSV